MWGPIRKIQIIEQKFHKKVDEETTLKNNKKNIFKTFTKRPNPQIE